MLKLLSFRTLKISYIGQGLWLVENLQNVTEDYSFTLIKGIIKILTALLNGYNQSVFHCHKPVKIIFIKLRCLNERELNPEDCL